MSYVPSLALLAAGLLVFGIITFRTIRTLRRFSRTARMVTASTQDRAGMICARSAALRVAIEDRRRKPENK